MNFHRLVELLFGAALLAGLYGVFQRKLDTNHANDGAARQLAGSVARAKSGADQRSAPGARAKRQFSAAHGGEDLREEPDAIFIAGDLYDGTAIDAGRAAEPLNKLTAPHGVYFVAGNHEQFGDDSKYLRAIAAAGVRVLSNEKVEVDGLQIIGVPYRNATQDGQLASALHGIGLDRDRASILLTHAPDHPEIAEAAGVSLQLSGHTHVGQFIPWSWMARRVYRQFVYGLSRIGKMQVFTSSGAGTWGPPLRLGSNPEIVVLEFESPRSHCLARSFRRRKKATPSRFWWRGRTAKPLRRSWEDSNLM
jgi:predicted phosphodiesterase